MKNSIRSVQLEQRKDRLLQALAQMLEQSQKNKVTTAALAAQLNISESSVYRCFATKSHMFEALIEFIERTLFGLINKILQDEPCGGKQIENLLLLLLGFSQKNPGMTRILISDVLINENEHLQSRIHQLHNRLEATLKQALRFAMSERQLKKSDRDVSAQADLLMCFVIGRWYQFVKSEFKREPLANWETQRLVLLPHELI